MERYKKRTVALILASVITVVGAFGADRYKNSLMSLKSESDSSGAVNMTLFTKSNYASPINAIKKDATTYIIMLPDTNCEKDITKDIGGSVESVDIRTMPYTTNANGYTKITVKTYPNVPLNTTKAIYVPEAKPVEQIETSYKEDENNDSYANTDNYTPTKYTNEENLNESKINDTYEKKSSYQPQNTDDVTDINRSIREFEPTQNQIQEREQNKNDKKVKKSQQTQDEQNPYEKTLFILGLILVITFIAYFLVKGKNKMAEIVGEQGDFDLSDKEDSKKETGKNKRTKAQKIKATINNIDRMYQQPITLPTEMIQKSSEVSSEQTEEDYSEEPNVVDLDELFQEKTKNNIEKTEDVQEDDGIDDLTDFLNSFSFESEESESQAELEQQDLINEELYEKLINSNDIHFSQSDIVKINELLNSEIDNDTLKNLSKYIVTNPIENKRPSHKEILENLITSYTISQNISFTQEDTAALSKLISVEIDQDFISDLRTNPQKVQEMREEIENQKLQQVHRHSELLTLNVKDMLPDLSEALRKQGGKKIESNAKPQVVYFSEGYDVSTLSLKEKLPDLSAELHNKAAYVSRPSDDAPIVESGYQYETLSVNDDIKNIAEELYHPELYENEKENKPKADENDLLQRISNVTFKPFYDGSESFEIINDFENDNQEEENIPTVLDVQKEFSGFEDFKIISDEDEQNEVQQTEDYAKDIFGDDVAKQENFSKEGDVAAELEQDTIFYDLDRQISEHKVYEKDTNTEELLHLIEEQQERKKKLDVLREERKKTAVEKTEKSTDKPQEPVKTSKTVIEKKVVFENSEYETIHTVKFTDKSGCNLVKNTKGEYLVIGYIDDNAIKLKQYDNLRVEKLEARVRAKLVNSGNQYIVKTGLHKFILNVFEDRMEFVMDLC